MKTDLQLRQEIAHNRKLLRERKRKRLVVETRKSYRKGEHEYIFGILAHTMRRLEIFRAAGGEADWFDEDDPETVEEIRPAICQACPERHNVSWLEGQWHHACELKKKCDAVKCARFICPPAHQVLHGRIIKWTPRKERAIQRESAEVA